MKVFLHLKQNIARKYQKKVSKSVDGFVAKNIEHILKHFDGFVARPPDRTLHDPCWRAARARTVEEKPRWQQQPTFEKSFHDTPVLKRQI